MKIAFRADSSSRVGSGHVMRCLTLAEQIRKKGVQIVFFSLGLRGNLCGYIESKGYAVRTLRHGEKERLADRAEFTGWRKDAEETGKALQKLQWRPDWLIVDHYSLDYKWENEVRPYVKHIMVIDDLADRRHDCDILLDQNLYPDMRARYTALVPRHCRKLLGPGFALLRPEFYAARKRKHNRGGSIKRILIFFGGGDPTNETAKALMAVTLLRRADLAVDVVVGRINPHKEQIRRQTMLLPNATFHCQVENMAELMADADFAIGAGGTTTWERCCIGLPSIILVVAENQKLIVEYLSERGALTNLGWHAGVTPDKIGKALLRLLRDQEKRERMRTLARQLVRGRGTDKVIREIIGGSHA